MKFTSILFLASIFVLSVSCSPSKEEQVMKTWKMADKKAEILFQFGENGAFSLQSENLDGTVSTNTGKWKFADGKEILLIELNDEEQAFKIDEMNDSTLVLLPEGEKLKMEFSVKNE